MVPFTYDLTLTFNNKSKVDVICFDFAKAFNSVHHVLILKKLKHEYKVDGFMLRFIKSYLHSRATAGSSYRSGNFFSISSQVRCSTKFYFRSTFFCIVYK